MMSPAIAFYGEIFVQRPHHYAFGFRHYGEQRSLGNSAAAGDGGESSPATGAQLAVYAVVMDVCAIASAPRSNPFREHLQDAVVSVRERLR